MLVFGHAGLTLGVAVLLTRFVINSHSARNSEVRVITRYQQPANATAASNRNKIDKMSWVESLADYGDVRLLLVGSLLPDIIDKPVGPVLLPRDFQQRPNIQSHFPPSCAHQYHRVLPISESPQDLALSPLFRHFHTSRP